MNGVDFLIMWAGLFGFGCAAASIYDDRLARKLARQQAVAKMRARLAYIVRLPAWGWYTPELMCFAPNIDDDALGAAIDAAYDMHDAGEDEQGQLREGIRAYQAVRTVKTLREVYGI